MFKNPDEANVADVTVCWRRSAFVQHTVTPGAIVTTPGLNAEL
jgi:hypothetical protein